MASLRRTATLRRRASPPIEEMFISGVNRKRATQRGSPRPHPAGPPILILTPMSVPTTLPPRGCPSRHPPRARKASPSRQTSLWRVNFPRTLRGRATNHGQPLRTMGGQKQQQRRVCSPDYVWQRNTRMGVNDTGYGNDTRYKTTVEGRMPPA
jgi:hypothetical protein